ncbi:MAG: VCBS repeat-containing protein [Planctomycetes bacterium]|nr:VCBS repeat-containing protein [Planctomycetota bacterium]
MSNVPTPGSRRWLWPLSFAAAGLLALAAALSGCGRPAGEPPSGDPPPADTRPGPGSASTKADLVKQVHTFCGACHAYPPPDSFPRKDWKMEVERGFAFFAVSLRPLQPSPFEATVKYYEERALEELPPAKIVRASTPVPVQFSQRATPSSPRPSALAISNVRLVNLFNGPRPDLLACDMGSSGEDGLVMALKPYESDPSWQVLGKVSHPAHAEVVDLDGDGIKDVLVANLGSFPPTDARCGSVVWLRGGKDGRFTPITLLDGVGRVADVQAADFRGVGKLDLVVAAFGWNRTGEILYLENQTTDWSRPKFVPRVLDERHGAIHVPVADLNKDGKPDFVALISQEHETVVAFLNNGKGGFRKETIYQAPHPAYGSSGIQLVDLDRDGNLDVLYTNGDVLDQPYLLKPYHGIRWLRNPGQNRFPFLEHELAPMYGVHQAVATDVDGDGKLDVVAVSFLPANGFPERQKKKLDAIILLEQTSPGKFVRHTLETVRCDHVSLAAGDVTGSGRPDLVVGAYGAREGSPPVTIWKNLGRKK